MEDRSRWVALGVLCTGMLMIVRVIRPQPI